MRRTGELVFLGAAAIAAALYALTVPDGLPWNDSTHLALAYLGEIARLPSLPHPIWGFHVQVFGGSVALSAFLAALAAGLVAVLVNRYLGWRFAASAALVWTFLPAVWNRAILGQRGVCLLAMAVVAAWVLNALLLFAFRKVRTLEPLKVNGIAAWVALGVSVMFALVSLTLHDYRLGEAASAFAGGVVEEAGERIIVMNGVCDDQVVRKANRTISLRNDEAAHTNLVAWARSEFPAETNLWVAAQVSAAAFVEAARKDHPERLYLMDGSSTTPEAWERRWEVFKPYLASGDPFVRVARRLFGCEGNAVANGILDNMDALRGERRGPPGSSSSRPPVVRTTADAWRLYRRIYEEVDPGNLSALVNMSEMIRRGCAVSVDARKRVQERLETFFSDPGNRARCREIARAAGPVRSDPELLAKMAEEAKRRIAEKIAAGEKVEVAPEILSLVEWNNEMVRLMDRGELVKAGRIARAILSNPKWSGFLPANAVMGAVASSEGDLVASEAFFRVATETTNRVATVVLNDYADTLMRLGKLDEAEKMARRAVGESDERNWLARLTLAEVLEKRIGKLWRVDVVVDGEKVERFVKIEGADRIEAEIRELVKTVLKCAPADVRERVRKAHKDFIR